MTPALAPRPGNWIDERLASRFGDQLVSEFSGESDLRPRWTPTRVAVYALAFSTLALTIVTLLVGLGLFVLGVRAPNVASLVVGVIAVGLAVLMRPRFAASPPGYQLGRHDAPALYELGGRIARALDTSPPDLIVVSADWNASWGTVGVRRSSVLTVGLPLLLSLSAAERVALVAHELAHGRNGDARRGLLVSSALAAQWELYVLLEPAPDEPWGEDFSRILNAIVFRPLMWLVSRPPYALLWLFARLTAHDAQRAEYRADELASRVAGTRALVELEETTLLGGLLTARVIRTAQSGADQAGLIAGFVEEIRSLPGRERERRRRVAALESYRLVDSFHPPMAKRLAALDARPSLEPSVVLSDADASAIDAELAPFLAGVERALIEEYRDALYAG